MNPSNRKTLISQSWMLCADTGIGLGLLWASLPETVFALDVAGVPLEKPVFLAAILSVTAATMAHPRATLRLPNVTALLAGSYMLGLGLIRHSDPKFLAADLLKFGTFLMAIYWIELRPVATSLRSLNRLFVLASLALALNVGGLAVGLIPPAESGARKFTYGLFHANELVLGLLPIVLLHLPMIRNSRLRRRMRRLILVMAGVVAVSAFVTATRSVLVVWATSVGFMIWLSLNGRRAIAGVTVLLICTGVAYVMPFDGAHFGNSTLASRLTQTNLESEPRIEEVRMMFDALAGDFLVGKGFGSRFLSCIGEYGEIVVLAPHIGIFTLLLKGGLIVWTSLIVLPFLVAIWSVAWRRGVGAYAQARPVTCAAWCPFLVYVAQSCVSGGWALESLFLCGMSIALASRIAEENRMSHYARSWHGHLALQCRVSASGPLEEPARTRHPRPGFAAPAAARFYEFHG